MLDYYKQRIMNDGCTMEEINSATKALEENLPVSGTISDFAKFYGKSEVNIRATIARKLLDKPKRVLLYRFHPFQKIVPKSWRRK